MGNLRVTARLRDSFYVQWDQPLNSDCPLQNLTYDVTYKDIGPVLCGSTRTVDDQIPVYEVESGITYNHVHITNLHPYSTYVVEVKATHPIAGVGSPTMINVTTSQYSE